MSGCLICCFCTSFGHLRSLSAKKAGSQHCFTAGSSVHAFTNYMKHAMTGDYFYPWDLIQQAGNVGELLNFITVPFPILYTLMLLCIPVMAVIVYFSGASLPLAWFVRYPAVAVIAVCMVIPVSTPQKVTKLLNKHSLYLEDMALQTSNYSANGFTGAFVINLLSSNVQKPETYSEETVTALMTPYTDAAATAAFSETKPDVIVILSESFWDPTLLPNTTFSEDPIPNYRALIERDGVISGRFFTTGYGGGTVRPEFEVLTGLSTDYLPSGCVPWQYVTKETDSYASVYKDAGYTTMAIHPYTSSFYCRKDAFPLIGIDSLYFEDEIYALGKSGEMNVWVGGGQITDYTFIDSIKYYMEKAGDTPVFLYGISMENHQPYPNKYDEHEITVENPAFDENVMNAVLNFTKGVSHADSALGRLVEYIDSREKETVLVWFGDHLPTLGAGNGAYVQSGMIGTYDYADYEKLYSTPFLIYANYDITPTEDTMLHEGKDNAISAYNLLNATAELIGAPRTAYMEYLKDFYNTDPYFNVRLQRKPSEEAQPFIEGQKLITYDVLAGQRYSYK